MDQGTVSCLTSWAVGSTAWSDRAYQFQSPLPTFNLPPTAAAIFMQSSVSSRTSSYKMTVQGCALVFFLGDKDDAATPSLAGFQGCTHSTSEAKVKLTGVNDNIIYMARCQTKTYWLGGQMTVPGSNSKTMVFLRPCIKGDMCHSIQFHYLQ